MLLRIQNLANGRFFILPNDGTLTADFNSTLFNAQSDLLGSYSYPLTMPLEPNRANIQNAQYINTSSSLRTLDVMMWLGAVPYKRAKLYFTIDISSGHGKISANLYYDLSVIVNQLKTIKLNQLSDPNIDDQFSAGSLAAFRTHMMTVAAAAPGVYPYTFFPYKNDGAYIDAAYVLTLQWLNTELYTVGAKILYTDNRIYECLIATAAGEDPIAYGAGQMVNPVKWQDITVYPDCALPVSDIINRWEIADDATAGFVYDTSFPVRQTQTPFFYLAYVLYRVCAYFGYTIESEWIKTDDAKRIVLFTNIPLAYLGIVPDYYLLMPDILVTDFLKEVRTQFGLLLDFDPTTNVCFIESMLHLESTGNTLDLRELQTVYFRETGTQSQAFTIEQQPDSNDGAFTEDDRKRPVQMTIGNPLTAVQLTAIQLNSAATKMIRQQTPVPVFETIVTNPGMVVTTQRIPWIKMPVAGSPPMDQISSLNYADRYGFKLRFLFYHGMQPDDAGFDYPYGSSDNLDINGNALRPFNLSLSPGSADFQAVQHYYNYTMNSKPFEMVFEMPRSLFLKIRNNVRIIVRDFNNAVVSCLIGQTSADFTNNKEKVAGKMTLYPKVQPDNLAEIEPVVPAYVPPPPFDNGVVYVGLFLEFAADFVSPIPPHYTTHQKTLMLKFFADAGGTIPKDVTNLDVRWQSKEYRSGVLISSGISKPNVTSSGGEYSLGIFPTELMQGTIEWLWFYQLMPDALYTII